MRKRPWVVAVLSSACCLLLLVAAVRFTVVSEVFAGSWTPLAPPAPDSLVQVASDATGEAAQAALPPAMVLDRHNVRGILGNAVRSAANEDMGRIVDVIVDRSGTSRAAVIDFGGFLGVGSRKIAVSWDAMRFTGLNHVKLDMTREQVKAAPQYEGGKPIVVLGASPEFARSRVTEGMPER